MTKINPEYTFIDSDSLWFDKAKADEFNPETGEILYFTHKDHFVLYTPPDDPAPERYDLINNTKGVTWMQANGFGAEITNKMTKPIKNFEM